MKSSCDCLKINSKDFMTLSILVAILPIYIIETTEMVLYFIKKIKSKLYGLALKIWSENLSIGSAIINAICICLRKNLQRNGMPGFPKNAAFVKNHRYIGQDRTLGSITQVIRMLWQPVVCCQVIYFT